MFDYSSYYCTVVLSLSLFSTYISLDTYFSSNFYGYDHFFQFEVMFSGFNIKTKDFFNTWPTILRLC